MPSPRPYTSSVYRIHQEQRKRPKVHLPEDTLSAIALLHEKYVVGFPSNNLDAKRALVASLEEYEYLIPPKDRNLIKAYKQYAYRSYVETLLRHGADPADVTTKILLTIG